VSTEAKSHRESPLIKFKIPPDGSTRTANHEIKGDGWLRGSTLLTKFRAGKVGVRLDLTSGSPRSLAKAAWPVEGDEMLDVAEQLSAAEFGVLLRTPIA
jgi:hypothetical protein